MLYPKPVQKPRPPILIGGYVDAVLKRAATKGDGWLTYYYTAESFKSVVGQGPRLRRGGRPQSRRADLHQPAADLHRPARQDRGAHEALAADRMGLRLLVGIDHGQRHHGHGGGMRGAAQPHIEAGIDRIIFVPYKYEKEQVEAVAQEIIPRLKKRARREKLNCAGGSGSSQLVSSGPLT